jgi:anti-sigma factor RsiW
MPTERSDLDLRVVDFLYGELEPTAKAALKEEIDADPSLAQQLAAWRSVQSLVQELPQEIPNPIVAQRLLEAARTDVEANSSGFWDWVRQFSMAPAFAGVFLLLVGGGLLMELTGQFEDSTQPQSYLIEEPEETTRLKLETEAKSRRPAPDRTASSAAAAPPSPPAMPSAHTSVKANEEQAQALEKVDKENEPKSVGRPAGETTARAKHLAKETAPLSSRRSSKRAALRVKKRIVKKPKKKAKRTQAIDERRSSEIFAGQEGGDGALNALGGSDTFGSTGTKGQSAGLRIGKSGGGGSVQGQGLGQDGTIGSGSRGERVNSAGLGKRRSGRQADSGGRGASIRPQRTRRPAPMKRASAYSFEDSPIGDAERAPKGSPSTAAEIAAQKPEDGGDAADLIGDNAPSAPQAAPPPAASPRSQAVAETARVDDLFDDSADSSAAVSRTNQASRLIKQGNAAERAGRCPQAVRYFQRYVHVYPKSVGAQEAHFKLATCYERLKDLTKAVYHYRQAAQMDGSWTAKAKSASRRLQEK